MTNSTATAATANVQYYVISREYVGYPTDYILTKRYVFVRTRPARTLDGEPVKKGTTEIINHWAEEAHGEYQTLAAAIEQARDVATAMAADTDNPGYRDGDGRPCAVDHGIELDPDVKRIVLPGADPDDE